VIYSEKLKEDILSEVKEKYDSFIMIDNKNNWDVLLLNSLIESFEGDKLEFKNFIQEIMKIFEFYYTSPQAQELSDG